MHVISQIVTLKSEHNTEKREKNNNGNTNNAVVDEVLCDALVLQTTP